MRVMCFTQPHDWRTFDPTAYGTDWDVLLLQRVPAEEIPGTICHRAENFSGWNMAVYSRIPVTVTSKRHREVSNSTDPDQGRLYQIVEASGIKLINVLTVYPTDDATLDVQKSQVREITDMLDDVTVAAGNFHSPDELIGLDSSKALNLIDQPTFKSPVSDDHRCAPIDKILVSPRTRLKIEGIRIWDPSEATDVTMAHLAITFDVKRLHA